MPDWIENTLYLFGGMTVSLFAMALAVAARRADDAAERRDWQVSGGQYVNPDEDDDAEIWEPRKRRAS